ncbi:proto-oncogene Mas-like [Littorina saxatilis]
MSTLIAFERCLCILWPLRAQRIIQTRTTAVIIFIGHVLIFAGHYLIATRWEVVCMFDPLIMQTTDAFFSSEFYLNNKSLVDLFDGIIFGILLPGIYVAAIIVSTVVTVYKLRQMAEWRQQSSSANSSSGGTGSTNNASKDVTLTRMLIGTSCLFIACTTPPLIFHAFLPFVPELSLHGKYYNTYYLLINMQQMFTYINASVNFFVYYFFGTKFRHSVQAMFCKARLEAKMLAKKSAIDLSTNVSTVSRTFTKISDTD